MSSEACCVKSRPVRRHLRSTKRTRGATNRASYVDQKPWPSLTGLTESKFGVGGCVESCETPSNRDDAKCQNASRVALLRSCPSSLGSRIPLLRICPHQSITNRSQSHSSHSRSAVKGVNDASQNAALSVDNRACMTEHTAPFTLTFMKDPDGHLMWGTVNADKRSIRRWCLPNTTWLSLKTGLKNIGAPNPLRRTRQ